MSANMFSQRALQLTARRRESTATHLLKKATDNSSRSGRDQHLHPLEDHHPHSPFSTRSHRYRSTCTIQVHLLSPQCDRPMLTIHPQTSRNHNNLPHLRQRHPLGATQTPPRLPPSHNLQTPDHMGRIDVQPHHRRRPLWRNVPLRPRVPRRTHTRLAPRVSIYRSSSRKLAYTSEDNAEDDMCVSVDISYLQGNTAFGVGYGCGVYESAGDCRRVGCCGVGFCECTGVGFLLGGMFVEGRGEEEVYA